MAASASGEAFAAHSVPELHDRLLSPVVFEPLSADARRLAGVRHGDRVVDLATGTGAVARAAALLASSSGRVVATDVGATMLAAAASHPPVPGAATIVYARSPATALALPARWFGVALCQPGLQFVDELVRAVGELRRVLRAGRSRRSRSGTPSAATSRSRATPRPCSRRVSRSPSPGPSIRRASRCRRRSSRRSWPGAGFASIEAHHVECVVRFEVGAVAVSAGRAVSARRIAYAGRSGTVSPCAWGTDRNRSK